MRERPWPRTDATRRFPAMVSSGPPRRFASNLSYSELRPALLITPGDPKTRATPGPHPHGDPLPSPVEGVVLVAEVDVEGPGPVDGAAAVLHHPPAVAGDLDLGAERVVAGIGGDRPLAREDVPEEDQAQRDHPGVGEGVDREEPRSRVVGLGVARGVAGVAFTLVRAFGDVLAPEEDPSAPRRSVSRLDGVAMGSNDARAALGRSRWRTTEDGLPLLDGP